jgi:hypothetical protein
MNLLDDLLGYRPTRPLATALACGCILLFPAAHAQEDASIQALGSGVRSVAVVETKDTITMDGRLDENVWLTTAPIGDLVQRQPHPGGKPSEKTEVILLRDGENLYIGIRAFDSEPDKIIGSQMSRDASLRSDDRIEILLDTFADHQNAFYFATNPAGALIDGLTFGNQQLNTDWDAIWDVRTHRDANGWSAEFIIPFKSLNFPRDKSLWGFNIARTIFRKLEENYWSGARIQTPFLQVSEAGHMTNMNQLDQGIGLTLRPFVAGSWLKMRGTGKSDSDFEPGFDTFYNITPSLKLTATMNTDFGETEVDARQINLTRFSLFFPEKRSFFLEDVGVFNFASTGPRPPGGIPKTGADVYPFFSRRIGLFNGEEVPIEYGGKLTGKIGRTELGLLNVRTRDMSIVEDKNFLVGRIKQNFLEQSYVGGLFTHGNPAPGKQGFTYGADVRVATSHFMNGSQNAVLDAYGLQSDNDNPSGKEGSFGLSVRYPNDTWDAMFVYREIQENFDPGIGFVQRRNVRMYRVAGSYNPRPKDFLDIQQMFHDVYYTRFDRLDHGELETSQLYITPLDWHFNSGDALHAIADYEHGYERLFTPFEISPGVQLPVGKYRTDRFGAVVASASKRPLSAFFRITHGGFWSGTAEQASASIRYRWQPHLTSSLGTTETFAHLPEGDFIARIHTGSLNYAFTPRLTFYNLIQYDNRSSNLGWQSRIRWTITPGRDLFVSLHQGWIKEDTGSLRFETRDTKLSAKFNYSYRF